MSKTLTEVKTPAGWEFNREEYYESRSVSKGRSDKTCVECGKTIPKGQKHTMHHFYPEFSAYATHDMNKDHGDSITPGEKSCTQIFVERFN